MSLLPKCIKIKEQRGKEYGDPADGFYTASAIAEHAFGIFITPAEIAEVQICLKMARQRHHKKEDNVIDMINYIDIAEGLRSNNK